MTYDTLSDIYIVCTGSWCLWTNKVRIDDRWSRKYIKSGKIIKRSGKDIFFYTVID